MALTRGDAPAPIKGSEECGARAQGGSCKEEQSNENESAEGGDDFEHLTADMSSGCAGKTSCNGGQARAWHKPGVGNHPHLRYFGARERGLRPLGMAAACYGRISVGYGSISVLGNRVTIVTCGTFAGSAPARRQARSSRKANAALRQFPLRRMH